MMYTARFEYERYGHNGYEGFKDELTAGGQNSEVYPHVLGIAGATVIGNPVGDSIATANHIKDRWQQYHGDERQRKEAPAEVADNFAGIKVGIAMWNYIAVRQDEGKLRQTLTSILCK